MKDKKVVVFDLDQTLGDFGQLSMFWFALQDYLGPQVREPDFYALLDLYPQYLRPNIVNTLAYLRDCKHKGSCYKVMIYTNNNGEKSWPLMIKRYLEYKIDDRLFDRTIAAYKARGKQIEPLRTTYDKTLRDLQTCGRLPQNVKICFIDDLEHDKMKRPNVFYIHIPAYHYNYEPNEMIRMFLQSPLSNLIEDKEPFYYHMMNTLSHNRHSKGNQSRQANEYNGQMLQKYISAFIEN